MKNIAHNHALPNAVAAQIAALRKEWDRALTRATATVARDRRPPTGWRAGEVRAAIPR
jgi:hypothetical protein